jgi:hypothetical protein
MTFKLPERLIGAAIAPATYRWSCRVIEDAVARIDRTIDELLVNCGELVLRLSDPQITRTPAERRALIRSVDQFSVCAAASKDARVHDLAEQLQDVVRPRLRLVSSRG